MTIRSVILFLQVFVVINLPNLLKEIGSVTFLRFQWVGTVSYTHLDVYKRQSSPRIELVKQTGADIRDNGFTQDVYVAPYKGDRVCAISYTFDKNRGRYMY